MYEYRLLKPVKIILRMKNEKREFNGGNESNQGNLHAYKEMSQ
jgi:hypothetical protein